MKNRADYTDHWRTPPGFYEELNKEFKFDFDPCPWMHDVNKWDGLQVEWGNMNFVNPPYSDKKATGSLKSSFVKKGIREFTENKKNSVFLLPVSTSTILFHEHILKVPDIDIRFLKGRLPFVGINDKGQHINFHLLQETNKNETVIYEYEDSEGEVKQKELQKYIKASGQHDSFLIIFRENKKTWKFWK